MVQGCGNKCVKYFFWLINLLFFVLGCAIVGLSIWLLVDKNSLATVASTVKVDLSQVLSQINIQQFNLILYVALAIGGALLILGFFGCCGSCCESVCAIVIYFLLVLILFVIEVIAIVLYFVKKNDLLQGFVTVWREELVSKYNTQQQVHQVLDQIQSSLQCCGAAGCSDYVQYGAFPTSCQCATVQQQGCATLLWNAFQNNLIYVAFVLIIVLFVEVLAMIFACIIRGAVKEKCSQA
uniref:Tetraspanin n=1 Tax=Caenorhabditis tropicalis TaxID=1561998 RepID=A0A1I7TCU7_9PELO